MCVRGTVWQQINGSLDLVGTLYFFPSRRMYIISSRIVYLFITFSKEFNPVNMMQIWFSFLINFYFVLHFSALSFSTCKCISVWQEEEICTALTLILPSRVGTLVLSYTAALEGDRKNICVSKYWNQLELFMTIGFLGTYCRGRCSYDRFSNCSRQARRSDSGLWAQECSERRPGSARDCCVLSASRPEHTVLIGD